MNEHAMDEARVRDEMFRSYVRDAVGSQPTEAERLAQLAESCGPRV